MTNNWNVASIGYTYFDPRVEDISFRSPETVLGSDVVLFTPGGLQHGYRTTYQQTYQGARSVSDDDSPRIVADVARRRQELQHLLDRGGTLVLFLPAPDHWFFDTGGRTHSGTGKNQKTTRIVDEGELYDVLPFPVAAQAAVSKQLEVIGGEPFASFWRAIDGEMQTSAYLTESIGQPVLRIKGSHAVVGSIGNVGAGTVIVLPEHPLYEDIEGLEEANAREKVHPEDVRFLDALFALVGEVRADGGEYTLPTWTDDLTVGDEEAKREALKRAEERSQKALRAVDAAGAAVEKLRRRKLLFTGSGKAFENVVGEAFVALGFAVEEGEPGRTDRVLGHPVEGPAVVEAKGKGKSAAEADCAQLEKWVSEYHVEQGQQPKGILVVNAWRDVMLPKRVKASFPDQMLPYAKARGHCLMTGLQLLGAWLEAEARPSSRGVIAKQIYATVGRFDHYTDWRAFISETENVTTESSEDAT
jgi:hypothetical protein